MIETTLYVVRYFKGEDTRMISKHAEYSTAFQMANRFVSNLKRKANEVSEQPVIVSYGKTHESDTRMTLTTRQASLSEGVTVSMETTVDPNWDYPRYTGLRKSDGGHMTTARDMSDIVQGDDQ